MSDVHRLIGSLQKTRASLALDTTDLCFLVALRDRAQRGALASFEEDLLYDVFEQVCDTTDPGAPNPRKRATHAIQRLREQRLLARVDGAGLVRAGEYALTRLAAAVVEFFVADERLTRESLTILTKVLRSQLAEALAGARRARTPDEWRVDVAEPLRITVRDLLDGIERRQRGLDAQQEDVREQIATRLKDDWFEAVAACEALMEETSRTLRELNEVLLQDTGHLQALLGEIEQLASEAGAADAEATAQQVGEHVDRVAAWGGARLRAWSDYYQFVQRYLRDIVRLDPTRALSQRLREQIAGWATRPFAAIVADAPSIQVLRDVVSRVERPPVTQARRERDAALVEHLADENAVTLEQRVQRALDAGASSLAAVLAAILPAIPDADHFRDAGRIAQLVAEAARVRADLERPWRLVTRTLEIEDWHVTRRPGR